MERLTSDLLAVKRDIGQLASRIEQARRQQRSKTELRVDGYKSAAMPLTMIPELARLRQTSSGALSVLGVKTKPQICLCMQQFQLLEKCYYFSISKSKGL